MRFFPSVAAARREKEIIWPPPASWCHHNHTTPAAAVHAEGSLVIDSSQALYHKQQFQIFSLHYHLKYTAAYQISLTSMFSLGHQKMPNFMHNANLWISNLHWEYINLYSIYKFQTESWIDNINMNDSCVFAEHTY